MKKILLLTFLLLFAFQSLIFAAASSSKGSSAPRSSPSVSHPASNAPAATPGTTSGYKPSAPANSYNDKAPAATAKTQQPQPQQQSTGSSFLRNLGMIGGGMLLGSMLGNMFGFGSSGMFSQIAGILVNVMILGLIFMLVRYLWNRFQASRAQNNNNRFN